jgi:hypothetical protein
MTPGTCETRKEQANGTRLRSRADIASDQDAALDRI